jgi:hypothetical protein
MKAWNLACIFSVHEKDKSWKKILSEQLRAGKRNLTRISKDLKTNSFNIEFPSSVLVQVFLCVILEICNFFENPG